jgi:RNA polymerase sigma-70 factor (ECF subfamily)
MRAVPDLRDEPDTQDLLWRVAAGDQQAANDLFERHRGYLQRVVGLRMDRALRRRVNVSDVIQEAYLVATQRLSDYVARRPMPFRLWLRKTAYECLLQVRRRHIEAKRRSVRHEVVLPDQSSVTMAAQVLAVPTPSEQFIQAELAQRVRAALAELTEDDREVLLMRNHEGLSNNEVAAVLGIECDAASKRYGRALLRLRKLLVAGGLSESQT